MLVIGAKGFAIELLEVILNIKSSEDILFYDDINKEEILFNKYPILKNEDQAANYFKKTNRNFTIGIGNPLLRYQMYMKFQKLGGCFTSIISLESIIGNHNIVIEKGCNILPNAILSNSVSLSIGCLIYYSAVITHHCEIGDFVEISPGSTILGRCKIGSFSQIGANATILPNVIIGKNVVVGAGCVVTKNIPDNCLVVGVPGKVVGKREKLKF